MDMRLVRHLEGHRGAVLGVRYTKRKGAYVLSCGRDRSVKLWNPEAGMLIQSFEAHNRSVLSVDASTDNAYFASCGEDAFVLLWEVSRGQRPVRHLRGHTGTVNCVRMWGPEDAVLVTAGYDKSVRVWDLRSRATSSMQSMDEAKDSVSCLAIRGTEVVTGSVDGCVRTYDVRAGCLRTDNVGPSVTSVSVSRDAACLLVSTLDNHVRLFDKDSGELLNTYKGHKARDYVVQSCFSWDDATVWSGSEDGCVVGWDLVEATQVAHLSGHKRFVCGLAYHPQQHTMVSASADGTLGVWMRQAGEEAALEGDPEPQSSAGVG